MKKLCFVTAIILSLCFVFAGCGSDADTTVSTPTTKSTAITTSELDTPPAAEPPHNHSYSAATCTDPRTCSCGATEGDANGHTWRNATCSAPQTCTVCGAESGTAINHSYSNGSCSMCGKSDPSYQATSSGSMVWIPTNGGQKYHSNSECSSMVDPDYVTESKAKSLGFTPCGRCH